jgi:glycosyltransferase involved in cell wall biosynthesis
VVEGKRRRRCAIIAAEFPPVGGGGVIRVVKLVKYLPPLGWGVTVIASEERLASAYDDSLLGDVPGDVAVKRVRPPLQRAITSVQLGAKRRVTRDSPAFRALKTARDALRRLWAIPDPRLPWSLGVGRLPASTLDHPEILISTGPPHSAHIAAALLARRHGIPFVADLRDEWTLRPSTRSRLFHRRALEAWLERRVFSHAARIVVVSEASRDRYAERYPALDERLCVIPNGYDPADLDGLVADTRIPHELVLGYAGSFQAGLDVEPIFRGIAAAIADRDRDRRRVRLHLVGPLLPTHIRAARRWIRADLLTIEGFLPHRQALERMASWDAMLVVAEDGAASLAGKTYECLALRRPLAVLAPPGPATGLVTEHGAGTAASPRDSGAVAKAIRGALAMADDPAFGGAPPEVLARFDRRALAGEWDRLLRDVIEARPSQPSDRRHRPS